MKIIKNRVDLNSGTTEVSLLSTMKLKKIFNAMSFVDAPLDQSNGKNLGVELHTIDNRDPGVLVINS